ncbi:prolyl oligopeptidase family serine peptidase [Actinomadura sp. 7K507]|uniref:alpha/beta hydrolase family esterase n=1 Tax=Actinomadura sp. 7K507 TaxID=2530365 RepID=UPI0014042E4E|nr:prolyl oligopeptidase family serine peptidase [Actinomadura sp. 7K507]
MPAVVHHSPRSWRGLAAACLAGAALSVAPSGTAHAAPPLEDRVTVTAAGSPAYELTGELSSGAIAVLDNVATYETDKIQGSGTLPGAGGGTANVSFQIARNVFGLKGEFTLKDPGAGVEISAKVNGGVTVPGTATVKWEGNGTVRRGDSSSSQPVTFTIEDRRPDPGDHAIRITHAGQARNAILRLPDDYDGTPRPVLFHFPGLLETPGIAEYYGRMADYAQTRGFIMITPEHYGPGWQGVPAGTPSPDVDDPGFVQRLQDILVQRFNADPKRLYASGMSNGGFFTSKMACDNDRFAAYVAVAGQLSDPASCSPGRHVPIVMIHGDGDFIVPYSTVQPALDFWTRNNECGGETVATNLPDIAPDDNTTVVRHDHPDCAADGPVVVYQIKGGGHNWPGGLPFLGPFLGGTTYDINANTVIWDFVSQHRLP